MLLERGVIVTVTVHADKFAAYLRMLKDRSGQGYERLGRQAGASGSSLHRYCSGKSVPADYRVVHSFAKVCGASAPETLRRVTALQVLAGLPPRVVVYEATKTALYYHRTILAGWSGAMV